MLRQFALQQDVQRRIKKAQAMMKEKGMGALFIPAQGAPGMMGMAKYFTYLQLWAGTAWVVVGSEHPEPALIQSSSYGIEWNKQEATTSWVESPYPVSLGRAIEICKEFSERDKLIGIVNLKTTWKVGDWTRIQKELLVDGRETIDVTRDINKMRSIKSNFEIEEICRTGRLLCEGLERFGEVARPGVRCWDAAAAAEQVLRSQGCFWGRSKYSLDLRPQTTPTPLDKRFFEVIGKHTPNCHSIGLDDEDGPSSWFTPDEILEPNMVLSFHPSTLLKGNKAFLISDNFLVTSEGAVPLSPREWVYRKIDL